MPLPSISDSIVNRTPASGFEHRSELDRLGAGDFVLRIGFDDFEFAPAIEMFHDSDFGFLA
jgi:hypothetical protein